MTLEAYFNEVFMKDVNKVKKIQQKINKLNEIKAAFGDEVCVNFGNVNVYKSDILNKIDELTKKLEFQNKIDQYEGNLFGAHYISKYFCICVWNSDAEIGVTIELEPKLQSFIYHNYISSNSGINDWVKQHTDHVYNFLSGNSEYNYALGTTKLSEIIDGIKKFEDLDEISKRIKHIVDFFAKESSKPMVNYLDGIIDVAKGMADEQI